MQPIEEGVVTPYPIDLFLDIDNKRHLDEEKLVTSYIYLFLENLNRGPFKEG